MARSKTKMRGAATSAALRKAIANSGFSQNEVARRAGIDPGMVNRFLHGSRSMTLATAEKVAEALELKLTLTSKVKKCTR